MIRSWRNTATRKVWEGHSSNQFRGLDVDAALDLLLALNVAKSLQDLSPLRSVGLHKLKGARSITADTAVRLGRYFDNNPQFWLDLQGQYDIAVIERDKGADISRRVRPADAA